MDWKKSGAPSQILVNNVLYRKSKDVAKYMNEFFVQKVEDFRKKFSTNKPNVLHCQKIMKGKRSKLSMQFVTVSVIQKIIGSLKPSRSSAAGR